MHPSISIIQSRFWICKTQFSSGWSEDWDRFGTAIIFTELSGPTKTDRGDRLNGTSPARKIEISVDRRFRQAATRWRKENFFPFHFIRLVGSAASCQWTNREKSTSGIRYRMAFPAFVFWCTIITGTMTEGGSFISFKEERGEYDSHPTRSV